MDLHSVWCSYLKESQSIKSGALTICGYMAVANPVDTYSGWLLSKWKKVTL